MKKNLIALAVAGAMVAPAVASAADVSLFGDARVRYTDSSVETSTSTPGSVVVDDVRADASVTTSRIRVGFKATEGNTMVTARMITTNGAHGAGVAGGVDVDYGYMSTKIAGMIDVAGGRMVANWGNKLMAWDGRVDRVLLSTSMINNVWIGLTFDKMVENGTGVGVVTTDPVTTSTTTYANGDQDRSSKKLLVKAKLAGGHNVGLLYAMDEDKTANAPVQYRDGNILDIYYNGKVGPVALGAEYYTRSGTMYEVQDSDALIPAASTADPTALMLTVGMAAGPVNLTGMYVSVADGAAATKYVDPFSTVGTNQDTALMNITSDAEVGSSMDVVGLVAAFPVNDALTVQGGFGVVSADDGVTAANGGVDSDYTILDVQASYKVDAKTTLRASYGIVSGEEKDKDPAGSTTDVDATVLGLRMQTSF